jgi:CCR4-NOT transcription complex subunit 1
LTIVLYYSNEILAKSLPRFGPYISLSITIINVIMTFPPILLIEVFFIHSFKKRSFSYLPGQRLGTKQLLKISALGVLVSLFAVGWGLNSGASVLSGVAIVTFVM